MYRLGLVVGLAAAIGIPGLRVRSERAAEPSQYRIQPGSMTRMAGPTLQVPRAPAPVIDGRIDSVEWAGAAVERTSNGLELRLQHDGRHLFLAVVSITGQGFPSACVVQGDTVHVLHASAALGSVRYGRSAAGWASRDTAFVYGMRNRDTTAQARAERREYLDRHQWLASTFRMGQGRVHEFQISLGLFDSAPGRLPQLALGYFRTEGAPASWPELLVTAGEGCIELPLLRGAVPPHPPFNPTLYPGLELLP